MRGVCPLKVNIPVSTTHTTSLLVLRVDPRLPLCICPTATASLRSLEQTHLHALQRLAEHARLRLRARGLGRAQQRRRRPKSVRNQPQSEVRHKELGTEVKKIAEINRKKIAEINPVGGFRSK